MAGGRAGARRAARLAAGREVPARGRPAHESIFECNARLSVGLVTLIE
jgi:hypothetical protein